MILDAHLENVPMNWAVPVVIVGAGPAGMTLARELAAFTQVLLVEAGGRESSKEQQNLLAGECCGLSYPLEETRARQFGGSSALWAGYCAVFDAHDFLPRSWVPLSGWPFDIETLEPYYAKVANMLNLGKPDFDARKIVNRAGISFPFNSDALQPTVWRFGTPTMRFGEHLRTEFETSGNLTTLIRANVVDIRLDREHSSVAELVIRTLNGREGRVSAHTFILASGGIETARLLLNADSQFIGGLGNSSGMVGRCFMEHPHRVIGPLHLKTADSFKNWTRRTAYCGDREFIPCVGLTAAAQEEAKVLNARAHIYRTPAMREDETPRVGLFMEQAPNPSSRLLLSNSTDVLGVRRVCLDWQMTELDRTTYARTACFLASEFEQIGAGRLLVPIEAVARNDEPILHSNHHLGTTRMSEHKEDGVVDVNCRTHDFGNLYIIGGSVFPTVSWANPTFTLMALTFRLAHYLRSQLHSTN